MAEISKIKQTQKFALIHQRPQLKSTPEEEGLHECAFCLGSQFVAFNIGPPLVQYQLSLHSFHLSTHLYILFFCTRL
jgi:hypothetical protein